MPAGPSGRVRGQVDPKPRSGPGGRETTSDTRGLLKGPGRREGEAVRGKHRPSQPMGTSHLVPELGSSRLIAPSPLLQANGSACCPRPVRGAAAVMNPVTSGTSTTSCSVGHVRTERASSMAVAADNLTTPSLHPRPSGAAIEPSAGPTEVANVT